MAASPNARGEGKSRNTFFPLCSLFWFWKSEGDFLLLIFFACGQQINIFQQKKTFHTQELNLKPKNYISGKNCISEDFNDWSYAMWIEKSKEQQNLFHLFTSVSHLAQEDSMWLHQRMWGIQTLKYLETHHVWNQIYFQVKGFCSHFFAYSTC